MSKSIKLKNNTFIDSTGIVHNKRILADILYPVGSIYLSVNSTSPADLFGGTWERMSGGFLYGCVNSPGNGNGTGTATNSHTLTTNQIPSHKHVGNVYYSSNGSWSERIGEYPRAIFGCNGTVSSSTGLLAGGYIGYTWNTTSSSPYTHAFTMPTANTGGTGGGQGHSHNIPYMAVYVWKRTA